MFETMCAVGSFHWDRRDVGHAMKVTLCFEESLFCTPSGYFRPISHLRSQSRDCQPFIAHPVLIFVLSFSNASVGFLRSFRAYVWLQGHMEPMPPPTTMAIRSFQPISRDEPRLRLTAMAADDPALHIILARLVF